MGANEPFLVSVHDRNGVTRIALQCELDMDTVSEFTVVMTACEQEQASTIMVDLRDVTFIDSSGLRAFLLARGRSLGNGHRLVFVGASASVRKVFEMTGMTSMLDDCEAVSTIDRFTRPARLTDMPANPGDLYA